jgi:chorismate mutase
VRQREARPDVMHESMCVRAVRGATTAPRDDAILVCEAVRELLAALVSYNDIAVADIVSATFTATPDLRSTFPARAARELGWTDVPMLCATEIEVEGALPRCLRVLLHVERSSSAPKLVPLYLREAAALRPDRAHAHSRVQQAP